MRRGFKWLSIALAALLLPAALVYAIDRIWLAPTDSHAETTKSLPLFDPSRQGLVRVRANGMEFRARVAGFDNRGGDGVILLHGFPETSIMWEPLLDKLAKAGFRAVAFDQRGYSPGARPFRSNAYVSARLARDVTGIAAAVGFEQFHVVGHDFGGAIAWIAAERFPREILSVTALSMPHPRALAEALADTDAQWLRSSYIPIYWIPLLPEIVLGFNQASYLQRTKWQWHAAGEVDEYKRVFSEPGALRGALNWYRAFRFQPRASLAKIRQPTLFLWGKEDPAFSAVAAAKTAAYVEGPYRFHKLNAGHFLMLELPEIVAGAVVSHLQTRSHVFERWNLVRANTSDKDASSCDQLKPQCLRISVTPSGNAIRIHNRCTEPYQGSVKVSCTGWAPDAFVEYRFNLGAMADLIQENNGFAFGDCYYSHRLCLVQRN